MLLPPEIRTRGVPLTETDQEEIRRRAAQLDKYYDRITSCRVALDAPAAHHHRGGPYTLRIELRVPGTVLVVDRMQEEQLKHAIQGGFDAARRRLEDYARRQRGAEKFHEGRTTAQVARLFPGDGYGFLAAPEGRQIYFHENSVLPPGFKHLHEGMEVRFIEEPGEEGPQASTVEAIEGAL